MTCKYSFISICWLIHIIAGLALLDLYEMNEALFWSYLEWIEFYFGRWIGSKLERRSLLYILDEDPFPYSLFP